MTDIVSSLMNVVNYRNPKSLFIPFYKIRIRAQLLSSSVTQMCFLRQVFDTDNKLIRTFGERGNGDGELDMVYGVCTDCDDNVVVADMWNDR